MGEHVSVEIAGDLGEVGKAQQAFSELCARHGELNAEAVSEVELALEEVLVNVVNYAYRGDAARRARVGFALNDGELTIEVEDDGEPFNPLEKQAPDLDLPIEERQIGGLGIHLVVTLMDVVEYQREDGKNRLRLKKRVM